MKEWHPTLVRQLQRYLDGSDPSAWSNPAHLHQLHAFLEAVSMTYLHLEHQLERLQHAYDVAAEGMFHQNIALQAHKGILSEIAQGAPLQKTLELVCRLFEQRFPDALCSILMVDESGGRLMLGAAPSLPDFYNEAVNGIPIGENVGSCGSAAYLGEPVIVSDVETDPRWSSYLELARQAGLRACWSVPLKDSAGKVLGTFAIYHRQPKEPAPEEWRWVQDFSAIVAIALERHRYERERQQLMEQLQQALQAAQAANEAKSRFLATMSHEIRTPLNGLLGMIHLAMQTAEAGKVREELGWARQSAESLRGILNDILDLSKIEAGKIEIVQAPFHLGSLLDDCIHLYQACAEEKGLELRVDAPPNVRGTFLGDGLRLRQVLSNLLANAVKFTSSGTVTLTVAETEAGIGFEVTDTGIGIPPDKQELIFAPFEQADSRVTRRYGGTGLGLTISAALVQLMGGELRVDSSPGEGSTFRFTLPLERVSPADAPPPQAPESVTGLRILVAEDNRVNRILFERLLQRHGHHVVLAADGAEAVERFRDSGPFDLILMDLQMPVMSGHDAAAQIRALEAGASRVPIIAVTAHALNGDREACLAGGFDDFLAKPIQHQELLACLERYATERRPQPVA